MRLDELLYFLGKEKIETWFDLGLFMDRFREERAYPPVVNKGGFDDYKEKLRKGGVAFISFHYMVDGVTVEVNKYASLLQKNIPGIPVHLVAGEIHLKTDGLISSDFSQHVIPEMAGFDQWELYRDLYFKRLERGSETYNLLIRKLWDQTMLIVEKLGRVVEENGINLLYLVNICSNPGNVAAALAAVLLSEFLKIPVINNTHDFYWEGGMDSFRRESSGTSAGPRDFFFTNSHLGEVFSIIEMLYPWQSRAWINVNINRDQSTHVIRTNGHNPSNVMQIGTAVDTSLYTKNDKRKNINTFIQVEKILSRYTEKLVSYTVEDVLSGGLVAEHNPRPILVGARTAPVDRFIAENIILLQPTRIISRKRIETSFNLLIKVFEHPEMILRFKKTAHLKITLLITGPIAAGHHNYLRSLLKRFSELLEQTGELKNRIYLALLFGELDRETFKERFSLPVGIAEMYNIASLVLLPSKTEGRGLPIIEATACGTPIFCRRYEPETVYSEVIGEHLEEKDRLKVLEFKGKRISSSIVEKIIDRVFFPNRYTEEIWHNRRVVNKRYSLDALSDDIHEILVRLHQQLAGNEKITRIVEETLDDYREMVGFRSDDLDQLLDTRNRHYLPGYSRLSFMLMLKSLIDPSHFRVEQQMIRGMAFHFARSIIKNDADVSFVPEQMINRFYNAVETLFEYRDGEVAIQHDHSMSYRHRNKNHYPYQDYTFQELTGLINLLYIRIVQPTPLNKVDLSPQFFTDWNLALLQLTGSSFPAIDDRKRLIERLKSNLPIAYFPGAYIMYELEFFALQSIRTRMNIPLEESVTREFMEEKAGAIQPVYIFAQEKNLGKQLNKDEITEYITNGKSEELRLLYEFGVIRIVRTKQVCVGIHFPQLGSKALKVLRGIRDRKGYILTNRSNAAMMTDMVDMDRFQIGKVVSPYTASIMGIPLSSGYIQFVPAGVRASLSYPSPVQTAKDFEKALKSPLFRSLKKRLGEEKVLAAIREDALHRGSPVMHVLESLDNSREKNEEVDYEFVSGVHEDGMPYNGALAKINFGENRWDFEAVSSGDKPKTVLQFVRAFNRKSARKARIAWNGGYILNPELVGKLGLPETYIGSPLGLIISGGEMLCPPLFNKPALLVQQDGSIDIRRVSCTAGLQITIGERKISFSAADRNPGDDGRDLAFYDLLWPGDHIDGGGRIIVRLAGNTIKEIYHSEAGEQVSIIPVGLTLAFSGEQFPGELKEGDTIELMVPGFENVAHAVEAGPLLLEKGEKAINMKEEGWLSSHSIRTQAARIDYTAMRGPKIAVGVNASGELAVLTVNGRIRESVGATHDDMATVLRRHGMEKAMGFDPGGSSTLVVGDRILNISPYNSNYMLGEYSLPPEPRAVSNAIIGFIEE
ncbi:MAG: glycosyltransferase [Bacteroidetes bacterium]|nr:glycosyltransferase [Bacteroidota bacterium]